MIELPKLPYSLSDLEPFIDQLTMEIHYGKHHQAYVDNLNKALEKEPELQEKEAWALLSDLDAIPEEIRTKVRNNAGGHANHSFFWKLLTPPSEDMSLHAPSEKLEALLSKNFGDFSTFKTVFNDAAINRFGSGWAWVVVTGEDTLEIVSTPNQDTPWMEKKDAVLGLDVWEHAYYLKYQNRRAEYITNWWNIVNWQQVEKNLEKALSYLR